VQGKDPALDTAIKAQIEDCLAKIAAIGTGGKSFYEVVDNKSKGSNTTDDDARVDAAVDACADLGGLFSSIAYY
jgi:polygalacturonase